MILAVPMLKQTLFRHRPVATGCSAVHSHSMRSQVVHPQGAPIEFSFKRFPVLAIRQCIQHNTQPVVTPFQRPHTLTRANFQRVRSLFNPPFNLVQPVIAF